jgi:ketosteroid isomerase-like protein
MLVLEEKMDATETIFKEHFQKVFSLQLDAVLEDFTEESVLFSPDGVFRGLDGIRQFYQGAMQLLTPDVLSSVKVHRQEFKGEFAYVVWSAGAIMPLASDTFHLKDGKILMQSFVGYMPQMGG